MDESNEYALAIIKPDGVKKDVVNEIAFFLRNEGLEEIKRSKKRVVKSFAYENFTTRHGKDEYLNYISSGESVAILFKGENAADKLRILKNEVRKKYSVHNYIKNIIHSPEPGNEYQKQFEYFFPNLEYSEHTLYIDMYAKLQYDAKCQNFIDILDGWCRRTSAKNIFVFSVDEFEIYQQLFECYVKEKQIFHWFFGVDFWVETGNLKYKIIGYFRSDCIHCVKINTKPFMYTLDEVIEIIENANGIACIGYVNSFEDIIKCNGLLDNAHIKGGLAYHPSYTIEMTEYIREQLMSMGKKIVVGGSAGSKPGACSVSYALYEMLFESLYDVNIK